jgi:flagellar basal-body rod protein FlgC
LPDGAEGARAGGEGPAMIGSLSASLSGLVASTTRLGASATNVANLRTTGPVPATPATQPVPEAAGGSPQVYQAVQVAQEVVGGGTRAVVTPALPSYREEYDPTDPSAGPDGMVAAPDVDPGTEVANQIAARASYGLSLRTLEASDAMMRSLLDLTT